MKDPYAQDKAELIAAKLLLNPSMKLSLPIRYVNGRLDDILHVVRMLQHHCGFPERSYQVKFNADIGVLRLSDYATRHACEPGDHFWLWGDVILGGSMEEYAQHAAVALWVRGEADEPAADSLTANIGAIVSAVKRLTAECDQKVEVP